MALSPRGKKGCPEFLLAISEDFPGSSTLSKEIHLALLAFQQMFFFFVLEEHKCSVELLIIAYSEFFSMLSFSLRNMLLKITLRLQ